MVLSRRDGRTSQARFADLPDLLPPGALLVANDTRVAPVRLFGRKPTGGAVEFLLLTPPVLLEPEPDPHRPGRLQALASGLLRASKAPRPGERVEFSPELSLTVLSRGEFGRAEVLLSFAGPLADILDRIGHMPLPPYIKRPDESADAARYQTVYADPHKPGSAAAPTAGLHFTPALRRILSSGASAGPRSPCTWATAPSARCAPRTSAGIACTANTWTFPRHRHGHRPGQVQGRPVIAVGTTSARALEGAFAQTGRVAPFRGQTDIFLRPGSTFHVIDGMITNFHLPGSTLLIMICALAGKDHVLPAYRRAITEGFRFFSYGDAMLIV
jgi:S-adenosylmethionine:tRNA ribosyltransferase-isomerase